jgi:hypothetical protein
MPYMQRLWACLNLNEYVFYKTTRVYSMAEQLNASHLTNCHQLGWYGVNYYLYNVDYHHCFDLNLAVLHAAK